eukprot:g19063.t1
MKQMKKQDQQVETLKEIFEEIDVDSSHTITFAELKEAFTCAKMESFMKSMGISTEDVWTLFMTVDADGSGEPLGCLEGISGAHQACPALPSLMTPFKSEGHPDGWLTGLEHQSL